MDRSISMHAMRLQVFLPILTIAIVALAACTPERPQLAGGSAIAHPLHGASAVDIRHDTQSAAGHALRTVPDSTGYACRLLDQLDANPDPALARIVAEPKRFIRESASDCFETVLDTITDRFVRDPSDGYLDAMAAIWSASDGDVADGITDDYVSDLLDRAFEPTLDYLYRHQDQNDLEAAVIESAAGIIEDADDPMAEMRAFRKDFRSLGNDVSREERAYLATLWRRIVAAAIDGGVQPGQGENGI